MISMPSERAIERASNRYPDLPLRAALVADFMETFLICSKGKAVGKPFVLIPWQLEALAEIYQGWPGDERTITRVLLSMARKQGKTEFASACGMAHLCGPEAGRGQELLCLAAANQEQAGLVWGGMRDMAVANPKLNRFMTYRDNRLIWKLNSVNNYCKTISTKPSSAQGLLPAWWSFDEIAEAKDRGLYEAVHYAQTDETVGGMGMIITTRTTSPDSLFTSIYDAVTVGQQVGRFKNWFVRVYSADPSASDLYTMEQVRKASPSIGYTISEKILQQDIDEAINDVTARPGFRARRLNIESGNQASLIDPTAWKELGAEESWESIWNRLAGERVKIGIDLGSTTSMTSIGFHFPDHDFVCVKSFMANTQVEKNETIHKVPYRAWADAKHLELLAADDDGGMTYRPIAEFIADCIEHFDVRSFRYDGWNMSRLLDALGSLGLKQDQHPLKRILDRFVQGTRSYGEAIVEFTDAVLNKRISHDQNPVTNMGINVCQVKVTNHVADEMKTPEKNKQQLPNDPALALLMALSHRGLVLPPKRRKTFAEAVAEARRKVRGDEK